MDIYGQRIMHICMLPAARCPLHCAAGRASMRAHMAACSFFQRAAGRASMRAFMVMVLFGRPLRAALCCKPIWLLAVPSSARQYWAGQYVSSPRGDVQYIQSDLALMDLYNKGNSQYKLYSLTLLLRARITRFLL